jgi:hypothetical protein
VHSGSKSARHDRLAEDQSENSNPEIEDSLQQAAVPPLAGFPVRNFNRSIIRSLTPEQAAGNALAIADQKYFNLVGGELHKNGKKREDISKRLNRFLCDRYGFD